MKLSEDKSFSSIQIIYMIVAGALFCTAIAFLIDALNKKAKLDSEYITNKNGAFSNGDFVYYRGAPLRSEKPGTLFWNKEKKKFFIVWNDGIDLEVDPNYYSTLEPFLQNRLKS